MITTSIAGVETVADNEHSFEGDWFTATRHGSWRIGEDHDNYVLVVMRFCEDANAEVEHARCVFPAAFTGRVVVDAAINGGVAATVWGFAISI